MKTNKTFSQRKEDVKRVWHVVDVKGKVLGRVATDIAVKLMGKNKISYTPHTDAGDYVIVTNASQIELTGGKENKKLYRHHSSFPGGLKETGFADMLVQKPEEIIKQAVKNMLPDNRLRPDRLARLKVYSNTEHPHQSQIKTVTNK